MPPIEWFYAQAGRQKGPVPPAEIKRLADAGELKPNDLVWREGMPQWAPAARVQGLFEKPESLATNAQDSRGGIDALVKGVAEESNASAGVPITETRELPADESDLSGEEGPAEPEAPSSGKPVPEVARSRRHVFEVVLDAARTQCPAPFVESTSRVFAVCGHYGLYAVMLILLVFGVVLSLKTESGGIVLLAAAVVIALAAFQYGARRSIEALERLNPMPAGYLSSTALTDGIAALSMMAGVILLLALALAAIDSGQFTYIPTGLLLFIVFEHIGFVAAAPPSSGILLEPDASAAEEALGLLAFFLKLMIRATPVLFGVGILWSGMYLLTACFWLFSSSENLIIARGTALYAVIWTFGYAVLPMFAHGLFLVGELLIEIARRFLPPENRLEGH